MIFRFIIWSVITYIIIKMLRVFIEPSVASKPVTTGPSNRNQSNTHTQPKQSPSSSLGEYVEYEEVK